MTRKDLLTLSPRLARNALASHITLYLEQLQDTQSGQYVIRGVCDLCPARCEMSFISPARLSYASADGLVGPFYLLCKRLDRAADSGVPDGRQVVTSAVDEEV